MRKFLQVKFICPYIGILSSRIYFGICPTIPVVCTTGQILNLSWICSTLAGFRLRSFAPSGSICSLSGFLFVQPYANPQVQDDRLRITLYCGTKNFACTVYTPLSNLLAVFSRLYSNCKFGFSINQDSCIKSNLRESFLQLCQYLRYRHTKIFFSCDKNNNNSILSVEFRHT